MDEKSRRKHNRGLRLTALVMSIVFTMTNATWAAPVNTALAVMAIPEGSSIDQLSIPEEMGTITKIYRGERGTGNGERGDGNASRFPLGVSRNDRTVILIQDAHAVIDAQENIRKILGHLGKAYGIRLTALEGAKGRLEPILLRTFPEPAVKRKILAGYENRAELSGPEIASVLGEETAEYRGMEDWDLYERNYGAYLASQDKKAELTGYWNVFKRTLDSERSEVYDPRLNEFQENVESFRGDRTSLLDLLIYLSQFKSLLSAPMVDRGIGNRLPSSPAEKGFPELSKLLSSIGYEKTGKQEALAPLVRKIADEFKTQYLRSLGVKAEMNFYNRYQSFMTGQITAGQMLQYLVQLGNEHGKNIKLTPELKNLLGHTELLSEIKGSSLCEELLRFLTAAEASLITTPAQRELAEQYRKLFLLQDLINLELTQEDYAAYQKDSTSFLGLIPDAAFKRDLAPALEFYRCAEERDAVFLKNIDSIMKGSKLSAVAVVAGGFHTQGLERIFKEKGISYAVVMPKIASLAGHENYFKVMKSEVSFKDYLKTTYFDALMRHAAKALVEALPIPDRVRTLKVWRDDVIRELAKEGRIAEAGKFLPYIDELLRSHGEAVAVAPKRTKEEILNIVRKELEKFKKESFAKIWKTFEFQLDIFTEGLKQLVFKKDLNAQTVSQLLDHASQSKPSFLHQPLPLGIDSPVPGFMRGSGSDSEYRVLDTASELPMLPKSTSEIDMGGVGTGALANPVVRDAASAVEQVATTRETPAPADSRIGEEPARLRPGIKTYIRMAFVALGMGFAGAIGAGCESYTSDSQAEQLAQGEVSLQGRSLPVSRPELLDMLNQSWGIDGALTAEDLDNSIRISEQNADFVEMGYDFLTSPAHSILPRGTRFPVLLVTGVTRDQLAQKGLTPEHSAFSFSQIGLVVVFAEGYPDLANDAAQRDQLILHMGHEATHCLDWQRDPTISSYATEANAYEISAEVLEAQGAPSALVEYSQTESLGFKILEDNPGALIDIFGTVPEGYLSVDVQGSMVFFELQSGRWISVNTADPKNPDIKEVSLRLQAGNSGMQLKAADGRTELRNLHPRLRKVGLFAAIIGGIFFSSPVAQARNQVFRPESTVHAEAIAGAVPSGPFSAAKILEGLRDQPRPVAAQPNQGVPSGALVRVLNGEPVSGGDNAVTEGVVGVFENQPFASNPIQGGQCVFVLVYDAKNPGKMGAVHFSPYTDAPLGNQLLNMEQALSERGIQFGDDTRYYLISNGESERPGFRSAIEKYFSTRSGSGKAEYIYGGLGLKISLAPSLEGWDVKVEEGVFGGDKYRRGKIRQDGSMELKDLTIPGDVSSPYALPIVIIAAGAGAWLGRKIQREIERKDRGEVRKTGEGEIDRAALSVRKLRLIRGMVLTGPVEAILERLKPEIRKQRKGVALLTIQWDPASQVPKVAFAPQASWFGLFGTTHRDLAERAGMGSIPNYGFETVTLDLGGQSMVIVPDMKPPEINQSPETIRTLQKEQVLRVLSLMKDLLKQSGKNPGDWAGIVAGGTRILGKPISEELSFAELEDLFTESRVEDAFDHEIAKLLQEPSKEEGKLSDLKLLKTLTDVPREMPEEIREKFLEQGFEIGEEVGRGSKSIVYKAIRGDRVVAIKVGRFDMPEDDFEELISASDERVEDPKDLAKVFEVAIYNKGLVGHSIPGLIKYYSTGVIEGVNFQGKTVDFPFEVLEFMSSNESPTLMDRLADPSNMNLAEALDGLLELHSTIGKISEFVPGSAYFDISSNHIFVRPDGGWVLGDLALGESKWLILHTRNDAFVNLLEDIFDAIAPENIQAAAILNELNDAVRGEGKDPHPEITWENIRRLLSQFRAELRVVGAEEQEALKAFEAMLATRGSFNSREIKTLVKVAEIAGEAHEGQFRNNHNLPYIVHPLDVARRAGEEFGMRDFLGFVIALLHDVREDQFSRYETALRKVQEAGISAEDMLLVRRGVLMLSNFSIAKDRELYEGWDVEALRKLYYEQMIDPSLDLRAKAEGLNNISPEGMLRVQKIVLTIKFADMAGNVSDLIPTYEGISTEKAYTSSGKPFSEYFIEKTIDKAVPDLVRKAERKGLMSGDQVNRLLDIFERAFAKGARAKNNSVLAAASQKGLNQLRAIRGESRAEILRAELRVADAPLVVMTGATPQDMGALINLMEFAGISAVVKDMMARATIWSAGHEKEFERRANVLLGEIGRIENPEERSEYLESPDFVRFMQKNFGDLGDLSSMISAIRIFASGIDAAAVIGDGQVIAVDLPAPARSLAQRDANIIDSMSAQVIKDNPRLSIGVMTNHSGPDSAIVLKMLQMLALERLIVLHRAEQPLGAAFRIAPLTPLAYNQENSKKSAEALVKKVLAADTGGNLVALWTEDMRIGKVGVYTIVAELGKVADPNLKALACAAIRYIFLKYASLDEAGRKELNSKPDRILTDLNKMGFGSVIQIKGNTLVFDMKALADSIIARQSIEQAA